MGILDSIVGWIAEQVMNILDLITGSVLGALGCDMSVFIRYFPAAETMYEIFVAIAIGFILLNLVWQLFKNYGAGIGLSAEDPGKLLLRSVLFILLAYYSDQIMALILTIAGTQARSGKVVGYITTDAHGVAASDPLPLGRYFVTEVSAPAYYQINSEKMEAEIEYPGQIIKLSQYDKPAKLGVTIKKSGNLEVQPGTTMRYDLSGIANTSNVALNNFYWHDRLPTDATNAMSLTTGTYNQRLYYRITFKTNVNDYRVLASNLLTSNNYSVKLSAAALGLVQGEYVTDIRFEFGTVASGFSSVTKPTIQVQVKGTLSDGYQIINRSDVGGQYLNEWQTATSNWVTIVRRFQPVTPLPKTGY